MCLIYPVKRKAKYISKYTVGIILAFISVLRPKQEQKKSQFAVLEPDIEAALGEIDGVDLSELAEILGETAINRYIDNAIKLFKLGHKNG